MQTIKPQHNLQLLLGSLLVALSLLLVACGGDDDGDNTVVQPPTEILPTAPVTLLPDIPTPVVFGTEGDPILFAFVNDDSNLFELAEVEELPETDADGSTDGDEDSDAEADETPSDVVDEDEATDEPDVAETEEATPDETPDEASDGDQDDEQSDSEDVEETEEPSSDDDSEETPTSEATETDESSDEDSEDSNGDTSENVEGTDEPDDADETPAPSETVEDADSDEDGDDEEIEMTPTLTPEELGPQGDGSPRGELEAQLNYRLTFENQNEHLRYLGLSLAVQVTGFDTMREALTAVCSGRPTLVWVDAFTYIAAEQACGAQPLYAVRLSDEEVVEGLPEDITVDGETGLTFDIVYNTRLGTLPNGVVDLAGTTVCRLGPTDPISWGYFSLTLRGAGLNPITDFASIVDVDDYAAMVLEILNDDEETCQVGAIPHGTLEDILEYLADEADEDEGFPEIDLEALDSPIRLLLDGQETWPEVPHMVLIASPEPVLSADFREPVVASFDELIDDIGNPSLEVEDVLAPFLRYEEIVAVDASDYNDFRAWLLAARWQMGQ